MDSKTVRRTGTAMSATADVSSRSTTASTRRMLEPPYTGISQNDLPCDGDAERCNHWSCAMHNWHGTAQHSTAQHSTAQHSTAQHSTAQHSTAQHSSPGQGRLTFVSGRNWPFRGVPFCSCECLATCLCSTCAAAAADDLRMDTSGSSR